MTYEQRKIAYDKVSTPEELQVFMDKYLKYGIYGTDNKVYKTWNIKTNSKFQEACQNKYSLCNVERFLKYRYGTCWDQVELKRDWFTNHNYEFKTLFIWFLFEETNNYTTHAYLIYKNKENNKYYYFEHSDFTNRGIYEFDTYESAIEYQKELHIKNNKNSGNIINDSILSHLIIYEFSSPKYGCNMSEYLNNILESTIIYQNGKYISKQYQRSTYEKYKTMDQKQLATINYLANF